MNNNITNLNRVDLPYPILVAHQPEFMPWLGNLAKASMGDVYYILDSVQYVNGVFQNRNKIRIKSESGWQWLCVPIKHSSGKLQMWNEVEIDNSQPWKRKHLNSIKLSYGKTPYFDTIYPEIVELYNSFQGDALIDFNVHIIKYAFKKFNINVPIYRTSQIPGITGQKSDLIRTMCDSCNANTFVFGTMGTTYIDWTKFEKWAGQTSNDKPIAVFQKFKHPTYTQYHGDFVSNMSFIDALFNCGSQSENLIINSDYIYE